MRRTYISLMLEAGENPRMVTAQVGHTDAGLTLRIYAQVMKRRESRSVSRVDALLREIHWAEMGRNPAEADSAAAPIELRATKNRPSAVQERGRGRKRESGDFRRVWGVSRRADVVGFVPIAEDLG